MSKTLERLKDGRLDILIATDVAARGLNVERISLVVSYDIPMDPDLSFTVSVVPVVRVVRVVRCCSLRTASVVCCVTLNAP
ncbi:helicase-related protein [Shigella flexneri]